MGVCVCVYIVIMKCSWMTDEGFHVRTVELCASCCCNRVLGLVCCLAGWCLLFGRMVFGGNVRNAGQRLRVLVIRGLGITKIFREFLVGDHMILS